MITSGNIGTFSPMEINPAVNFVHKVEIYSVVPATNAFLQPLAARKGVQGSRWNQSDIGGNNEAPTAELVAPRQLFPYCRCKIRTSTISPINILGDTNLVTTVKCSTWNTSHISTTASRVSAKRSTWNIAPGNGCRAGNPAATCRGRMLAFRNFNDSVSRRFS
jgi:hypothetical protein